MNKKIKTVLSTVTILLTLSAGTYAISNDGGVLNKLIEAKTEATPEVAIEETIETKDVVTEPIVEETKKEEIIIESITPEVNVNAEPPTSVVVPTPTPEPVQQPVEVVTPVASKFEAKKQYNQKYDGYDIVYSVLDQENKAVTVVGGIKNTSTQDIVGFNVRLTFKKNGVEVKVVDTNYTTKITANGGFNGDPFIYVKDISVNDFDELIMTKN